MISIVIPAAVTRFPDVICLYKHAATQVPHNTGFTVLGSIPQEQLCFQELLSLSFPNYCIQQTF